MQEGDFKIFNDENGFDIFVEGGQPKMTGGLTSAILISLFTNSKSDGSIDYWYDSISGSNIKTTGTFWTVLSGMNSEENRNRIPLVIDQDLRWMIDRGIIEKITTTVDNLGPEKIMITISINEPENLELKFKINWDSQKIELIGV